MDSYATKEGSVAIATNNRVSTRSTRKSKSKVPTPRKLIESLTSRISSKKLGEGVMEAHREFIKESPTFFAYFKKENQSKNLKPNAVFLYDYNRVVLSGGDGDYYHASYVDGVAKKNQYIMAQAPFDTATQVDFFRMLSQQELEAVVVMGDPKNEYFKFLWAQKGTYGGVSMSSESVDECEGFCVRNYTVNKEKLKVYCITGWTVDHEPPKGFVSIHEKIRNAIGIDNRNTLLLVCRDGCSRCGLFCILDMESERLRTKGRLKFTETVKNIRNHRSSCFDTHDLFDAAASVIMELAKRNTENCRSGEIKTV
ncbi:Receptor-type tyrosine-protein phosphatase alpha [Trichostrongylus colubriformis]|uniref:Receptor-type tyrosine-protein phosphatase alpha n=1 Tax=Trichostrongylus colubriformis TaxID=6319 RepID=A0AAN8IIW5_TRICO